HHHALADERRLHDDDAGAPADRDGRKAELHGKVDHRHDAAAEVDDATNVRRRRRHLRDDAVLDDLLDAQHADGVLLVGEKEGQVLPLVGCVVFDTAHLRTSGTPHPLTRDRLPRRWPAVHVRPACSSAPCWWLETWRQSEPAVAPPTE